MSSSTATIHAGPSRSAFTATPAQPAASKNIPKTIAEKIADFVASRWGKGLFLLSVGLAGACLGAVQALSIATIGLLIAYVTKPERKTLTEEIEKTEATKQQALNEALSQQKVEVIHSLLENEAEFKKAWARWDLVLSLKNITFLVTEAVKMGKLGLVTLILSSRSAQWISETTFKTLMTSSPNDEMLFFLLTVYSKRTDFEAFENNRENSFAISFPQTTLQFFPKSKKFFEETYGEKRNHSTSSNEAFFDRLSESPSKLVYAFVNYSRSLSSSDKPSQIDFLKKYRDILNKDPLLASDLVIRLIKQTKLHDELLSALTTYFPNILIDGLLQTILEQRLDEGSNLDRISSFSHNLRLILLSEKLPSMSINAFKQLLLLPEIHYYYDDQMNEPRESIFKKNAVALLNAMTAVSSQSIKKEDLDQIASLLFDKIKRISSEKKDYIEQILCALPFFNISKELVDALIRQFHSQMSGSGNLAWPKSSVEVLAALKDSSTTNIHRFSYYQSLKHAFDFIFSYKPLLLKKQMRDNLRQVINFCNNPAKKLELSNSDTEHLASLLKEIESSSNVETAGSGGSAQQKTNL